ncbi:TspO/MBR family protein [Actinokineospora soli]|uniref:TspO/MBR family protein n=1 Tax=Actinokineospora soli TaxID=1048753 RepID=A0ABW2TQS9_9PSEU
MTDLAPSRFRPVVGLVGFLVAVAVVAVVGSLAAVSAQDEYLGLRLPGWAPPSWLFGPVWTVLYVLIAVSGWLVWRRFGVRGASRELGVFGAQLVLNALWTPLFFGLGLYGVALVDIVVLLGVIVVLIGMFARKHRVAAWLLVPYAVWVGYATALNAAIVVLN